MEHLFAPWRIRYILAPKHEGCIFCDYIKENEDKDENKDRKNLILYRGRTNFIMMNRFPYNPGHLMVSPYKHVGDITDLTDEELIENIKLVKLSEKVIREAMEPHGFNIGINIGSVAGAGLEEHLHTHIVPRWNGDASYIAVLSDVRVIPEALEETYDKLKEIFNRYLHLTEI